jgi:hypothetical protein
MAQPFNPSDYLVPPIVDVPGAITLANALLTAKPKGAPDHVKAAAKAMKTSLGALSTAWGARGGTPAAVPTNVRQVDHRVDVGWGSLFRRLSSLAELAEAGAPRAVKAAALRDDLFGTVDPLGFLTVKYRVEWAEVKKRIERLDGDGGPALCAAIDDLAGPEWVPELRASFADYGKALGVTAPAPLPPDLESLTPLLREVQRDIGDYAIAVLGMRVKKDAKTTEVVRAALQPIAEHRASNGRAAGGAAKGGADEPPKDGTPNGGGGK